MFIIISLVIVTFSVAIFLVTLLLLGNVTMSLIIVAFVLMIEVDVVGVMVLWGISILSQYVVLSFLWIFWNVFFVSDIYLNAASTVNLVMAIGISVEFCMHIEHALMTNSGRTRQKREHIALVDMGSSVVKGITLN
jgi:Niemann-Pick C1 protein